MADLWKKFETQRESANFPLKMAAVNEVFHPAKQKGM